MIIVGQLVNNEGKLVEEAFVIHKCNEGTRCGLVELLTYGDQ